MPNETNNLTSTGALKVSVTVAGEQRPIAGATVTISSLDTPGTILETLTTNSSGQTPIVNLPAPPVALSLDPQDNIDNPTDNIIPYARYLVRVTATGFETVEIRGTEVLGNVLSLQAVAMQPATAGPEEIINIPDHTLYGNYPPKIPEPEIKPITDSGEIVLNRVVIPEFIIVHDGLPDDTSAPNYYVRYKDYIKNVASSEIYPTWPESAIYANILAIMSFTLNRVYTEFYFNRGYNFTITSSTAYDQKWIMGRNVFDNISYLVDSVFNNYLARPGVIQPIFTSYCDGQRTTCRGLSQWGSQQLGEEGYSAINILRYYYGNDIYINSAEFISGVPFSWPGYTLGIGSAGDSVRQVQTQINRIARNYPALPTVTIDGIYGEATADAIRTFQGIFNLPVTGTVDAATWYELSEIYVGVSRIAEPM